MSLVSSISSVCNYCNLCRRNLPKHIGNQYTLFFPTKTGINIIDQFRGCANCTNSIIHNRCEKIKDSNCKCKLNSKKDYLLIFEHNATSFQSSLFEGCFDYYPLNDYIEDRDCVEVFNNNVTRML